MQKPAVKMAAPGGKEIAISRKALVAKKPVTYRTYQVKPGDSLIQIAKQHGVEPVEIAKPSKLTDWSHIVVGQELRIPELEAKPVQTARKPSKPRPVPSVGPELRANHIVQKGDCLYRIADIYGVSIQTVADANELEDLGHIVPGQNLTIPKPVCLIYYDEKPVPADVRPFQKGTVSFAPFRHIIEHKGGTVMWYPETRQVKALTDSRQIELTIGKRRALVNQDELLMELAPFIKQGRTVVPLSFVRDALDTIVEYDAESGRIYIVSKD